MSDLVAFLRECLAEDEATARAANRDYPAPWTFLSVKGVGDWIRAADGDAVTPPVESDDTTWEVDVDNGRHIARWDPALAMTMRERAEVLAEVDGFESADEILAAHE